MDLKTKSLHGIKVRREERDDWTEVNEVIRLAFKEEVISDQTEHLLVQKLRKSGSFIPELSRVATINGKIVGHILLTKISIMENHKVHESLALAPVSVLPEFQSKGVGSLLILDAHDIARALGYTSVVLVGHEDYYPRFGYKTASLYNIHVPFDAPDENVMALELIENGLKDVKGMVQYDSAFGL